MQVLEGKNFRSYYSILAALILTICTSSCGNFVQLYQVKGDNSLKVKADTYIYENDSIRIAYYFWNERGIMSFAIFNKLDQPIYIDWKKSSFVTDGKRMEYWIDESFSKTESRYDNYKYFGSSEHWVYWLTNLYSTTYGSSETSTVKAERISFIPPKSYIVKAKYFIFSSAGMLLSYDREPVIETLNGSKKTKTKKYVVDFDKSTTPVIFRNFLTMSTDEKFPTEFRVDNEFYIDSVVEMTTRHFGLRKEMLKLEFPDAEYYKGSYYRKPKNFWIEIDRDNSIVHRKMFKL